MIRIIHHLFVHSFFFRYVHSSRYHISYDSVAIHEQTEFYFPV
jgi:hypothetical protein